MRQLTDKEVIKHVGAVKDFREWWEGVLAQIELVADELVEFIQDAQDIALQFAELPFSSVEFYELLGFPDYLCERAASDAEANAPTPSTVDMWTLHSGATYALTHFFQGKEGAALDRYVRVANDILFNPEGTVERVERAYEEQLATKEGSQASLAGERALASIERVGDDVRAKAEQFEEREEALREHEAPAELVHETAEMGRLPVVNFAAGGIATPADAALMMYHGCDGIFVGSGIFGAEHPEVMAEAIVNAVNNWDDPETLADIATGTGKGMKGEANVDLPEEERLQQRGV